MPEAQTRNPAAHDLAGHWHKVYQDKPPEALTWFQGEPEPSLSLITAQRPALEGLRFIDVGAGASKLVDALLDRGLAEATLLDIAPSALAVSRARLEAQGYGGLSYLRADITRWQPQQGYDIWHDRAVFHFLTAPADQQAYRRALLAGTVPGSLVVLSSFAPDGPEKCSGLPVQRWDAAGLQVLLGSDFALLARLNHQHQTPSGGSQSFLYLVFERR